MLTPFGKTTAPGAASTMDDGSAVPSFALVIVWSASQMHRVGDVAFFPFGQELVVARGDDETLAQFVRQRPGEISAFDPHEGFLTGNSISRRHLTVLATEEGLQIEHVGGCRTFVNGVERKSALLKPGDTVRFKGELVLLCVRRPRTLPGLRVLRVLQPYGEPDAAGIVGESPQAWCMRDQLATVAASDDHALIGGESGTGKELAVKAVRQQSPRANGPFVPHNASTFTTTLLASELFGNPVNYPNHGMLARKGLVGEADRGILFLDEIGDCPLDAQTELLRFLDHGEYHGVGESKTKRADVRVIGATNKEESAFRADFLARFRPHARVRLPPLRERREDIPLLIRHLLVQSARKSPKIFGRFVEKGQDGRLHPRISGRLVDHLVRHPLLTNYRALEGLVLKAANASRGDVVRMLAEDAKTTTSPREETAKGSVPSKAELESCLDRERGNVARAARVLGLGRTAMYRLMQKHGVKKPRGE